MNKFHLLKQSKERLHTKEMQLQSSNEEAIKEYELLKQEQEKLLEYDKKITNAYDMLRKAFLVMEEDKFL